MPTILLATYSGCRTFTYAGEGPVELAGHPIAALAAEPGGACLAIVDGNQIWRRNSSSVWSHIATAEISLQSLASEAGAIYAGGMDEAILLRIKSGSQPERVHSFDQTPGRETWFAGGPPLGVRSLAATLAVTPEGSAILAAVHVGGIPRSNDQGATWTPTIPILWDVHEVRAHPTLPNLVAAAAAVGVCISRDAGRSWSLFTNGQEVPNALAVAVLEDEVLFSVQDGPFAKRSQIWRFNLHDPSVSQVREGLPEWLEGKVDTGWIAAGPCPSEYHGADNRSAKSRAAVIDAGGNLWLSKSGSTGWELVSATADYPFSLVIL
jgi:hypothetical protein